MQAYVENLHMRELLQREKLHAGEGRGDSRPKGSILLCLEREEGLLFI
jgi:hypothetical protein